MLESRRTGTARRRDGNLCGIWVVDLIIAPGRHEAYQPGWDLQRNSHEVGIAERRQACPIAEAPTELLERRPGCACSYSVRGWIPARIAAPVRSSPPPSAKDYFFLFEGHR